MSALDEFTSAYVEAALWSSNDNADDQGGEPLDANYGPDDIDPKTMQAMEKVCSDFLQKYGHLIEDDESPAIDKWGRWELAGHDLWLTSAGHGAGFGDGNFPKHDDELYEAARKTKSFDLYVGDDGVIYAGGHEPPRTEETRRRRQHTVADFDSMRALIEHAAQQDGATHVIVLSSKAVLFYPSGRYWPNGAPQYEAGKVYRRSGYWHSVAPSERTALHGHLPGGTETIEAYLSRTAGSGGHEVKDYVPVDNRGQPVGPPDPDYQRAKREADKAGGYVKFTTGRPPMSEAFGRKTQWTDWMILDSIDKGNMLPPEAERRALKLAQLGFIDTTGTWRLTAKGRQVVDRRVPVAAEAKRGGRTRRGPAMTGEAVMSIAGKLAGQVGGGKPALLEGGFRWSEPNASARFTTYSPEHGQKVVVVVSLFEDGSAALNFFSDEGLSGTDTYENISHFTYGPGGFTSHQVDVKQMVEDVNWVLATVDGYAASWQQPEVDERRPRRPEARGSRRSPPTHKRRTARRTR